MDTVRRRSDPMASSFGGSGECGSSEEGNDGIGPRDAGP